MGVYFVLVVYLVIAAYFFGENNVTDYYKGMNETPRGILRNLVWALAWPAIIILRLVPWR